MILALQAAMTAADGATTEPRIRISRRGDENARCKGSRAWDRRKDFSRCMRQSRIPSAFNVISPRPKRTEPFAKPQRTRGARPSQALRVKAEIGVFRLLLRQRDSARERPHVRAGREDRQDRLGVLSGSQGRGRHGSRTARRNAARRGGLEKRAGHPHQRRRDLRRIRSTRKPGSSTSPAATRRRTS